MGYLSRLSTTVAPARVRAATSSTSPYPGLWTTPEGWMLPLDAAGIEVTPELGLTLSHVFCAVSTITDDFGTFSCQTFEGLGDDLRARVKYSDPAIGRLAYQLRWQPNMWQTAKAFWSTLAWQYLLRPSAYAELTYRPGAAFVDQIIPRHPDRVKQETLATGRLRFKLTEADGTPRYVTQDEMLVVRNTCTDGLNAISRMRYGAKALSSGLVLQDFTRNYFRKGATAAIVVTYKGGQKEEADEADLHASLSRYMAGAENAGGLLVLSEDLDTKQLGVEPQKAELLGLKNLSGRDVARLFKMPPTWLAIEGSAGYGSQVQDAENYKNRCQLPMAVEFEQAIQRDLILAVDRFFVKFNMDYLTRGNLLERMQAYEIGIKSRVLRPSECRLREDLPPDPRLDQLSEGDYRPGTAGGALPAQAPAPHAIGHGLSPRAALKATLAVHDNAARCLRRERVAVEKIAKKYPSDVDAWQAGVREFYTDHSTFVAHTMRVSTDTARAYAAQHGALLEDHGVIVMSDAWAQGEAEELAALALAGDREAM